MDPHDFIMVTICVDNLNITHVRLRPTYSDPRHSFWFDSIERIARSLDWDNSFERKSKILLQEFFLFRANVFFNELVSILKNFEITERPGSQVNTPEFFIWCTCIDYEICDN